MRNETKRGGFTLIELLTVIAIIGILASIVVVAVNEPRKRGRDAKRISDLKSIKTALEMYYEQNQKYPTTCAAGQTCDIPSNAAGSFNNWAESGVPAEWDNGLGTFISKYLSPLPEDPLEGKKGIKTVRGDLGNCNDKATFDRCPWSSGTSPCPMTYIYYSDNGQRFKAETRLETLCDSITDGGKNPAGTLKYNWYEVWGGDGGQSI